MQSITLEPITAPKVSEDFHTKLRTRFYDAFQDHLHQQKVSQEQFLNSGCFFKGISAIPKNYEDTFHVVQQQSTFWYLFGVKQEDCYALITPSKQKNQNGKYKSHTVLFVPHYEQAYKMWMFVKSQQQFKTQYKVQQVKFVNQIQQHFSSSKLAKLYLYYGVDTCSKIAVELPQEKYYSNSIKDINKDTLWPLISNLRTIKTQQELQLLRYVCKLTTQAHIKVIHATKAGLTQIQPHTLFHFVHSSQSGSIHLAFDSICSSGVDCATLHYIENNKVIQPGQMCLHDMGGKWYGYCADQAITFPVDKKFTEKQKHIYNAVYEAQKAVLDVLKVGQKWDQMHLLAQKVILQNLIKIGIIKIKGTFEEEYPALKQKRVGAIFFPHGLGHFHGLRVHDIGGYTKGPQRSDQLGLKSLRTRRVMQENMVITVEPGCYFIDFILENALNNPQLSPYLCKEKIDEYRQVGGVRLQDNVIVKKDGVEMLSFLPRKIEDLQKVMAEGMKQ